MHYRITGLNPLTGRREQLTPPCSLDIAQNILDREKSNTECIYKELRIE